MKSEKPMECPKLFEETFIVQKPLGLRIHKNSFRVTYVEANSAMMNKVAVGDTIVAVDGVTVNNVAHLNELLAAPVTQVKIRIRHSLYSICHFNGLTLERIPLDRNVVKASGQTLELFVVFWKIPQIAELNKNCLQWSVRGDSRERIQIAKIDPNGLAGVHLKVGDIIRSVNGKPVTSKSMLFHRICDSVQKEGFIQLGVERAIGIDDQTETTSDVVEIARKQLKKMKSKKISPAPKILRNPSRRRSISFAEKPTEHRIQSDHDISKLKPCKNAKI